MSIPIPDALSDFILGNIETISQLEALLLLRRSPEQEWDAEALAKALYVPVEEAANVLAGLQANALVTRGRGYRYAPQTAELAAMVDLLAETYARALIPVTNLVHANPQRFRRFADAFKFRKDH